MTTNEPMVQSIDRREIITRAMPDLHPVHAQFSMPGRGSRPIASAYALEQLPFAVDGALEALLRATHAQEEILGGVEPKPDQNSEFYPDGEALLTMAHAIDSFLDAIVRAQNSVCLYLGQATRRQYPSSFRTFIEDVAQGGRQELSSEMTAPMLRYWQVSGRTLRDHRDLSQHFVVVSSDVRVIITGGVVQGLSVRLPSNPEVKAPEKLDYGPESPEALLYCIDAWKHFAAMVQAVMAQLTDERHKGTKGFKWVGFRFPLHKDLRCAPPISLIELQKHLCD